MTNILLFHHAMGLTSGVVAFADQLRSHGHEVSTPDLFDGQTFAGYEAAMSHVQSLGMEEIVHRGEVAARGVPDDVVYAGMSLGAAPAQKLAQSRISHGALLLHGSIHPEVFGSGWPADLRVQIHAMDADPFFTEEGGDIDAARAIVGTANDGELFLYPGHQHLFTDSSLAEYDEAATALVIDRINHWCSR